MENIRERIENLECLVNGLELKTLKKHIKNLENRVRKVEEFETRIKSLEMFISRIEFIESQLENFSNIISDIQNKPERELLEYFFNRLIEEADFEIHSFDWLWEKIGKHFMDKYENEIKNQTEVAQTHFALAALTKMELITQSTIKMLEKLSKESIEMVKNKEN